MKNKLSYPLEMYYPDYDFDVPSFEDQMLIIKEYKNYIFDCNQNNKEINKQHITVEAMQFLLDKLKQQSYFEGVRHILNFIFSELKTPDDLFTSMFPDKESLVSLFKQQFLDACELILIQDEIDWDRMNLSWYHFKQKKEAENEIIEDNELEKLKNLLESKVSILKNENNTIFN